MLVRKKEGGKKVGGGGKKAYEIEGMSQNSPSYLQKFLPASINPSNFRLGSTNCTESQNGRGWGEPLEIVKSNLLAKADES